jgi:hypothetical protein
MELFARPERILDCEAHWRGVLSRIPIQNRIMADSILNWN